MKSTKKKKAIAMLQRTLRKIAKIQADAAKIIADYEARGGKPKNRRKTR